VFTGNKKWAWFYDLIFMNINDFQFFSPSGYAVRCVELAETSLSNWARGEKMKIYRSIVYFIIF